MSAPAPELYTCIWPPFSNIFSSETARPIKAKFHVEPPWEGGTKVYRNGPGHMTKMATMPIYGKNFEKSSSPELEVLWSWNLACSIRDSSSTRFILMMTQAWPWPILPQGQIGSYMCLNRENFYKVINWEKLAVNDQFDRKFMFLTKKCSQGVVCPCPWTIYMYMTIISNISSESTVF